MNRRTGTDGVANKGFVVYGDIHTKPKHAQRHTHAGNKITHCTLKE